jgi:c-di-GMP-binding flagellar brake protein YcgR
MNTAQNIDAQPKRVRGAGYDVEFKLGQRCLIQFETGGQKYRSSVIGVEHFTCIMCKIPLVPGIQQKLIPGQNVNMRVENGGTLYAFTTQIVGHQVKPTPFLVVGYPEKVDGLQYRRHKRCRCMLPAEVLGGHLKSEGLVTDISLGGCRAVLDWREQEAPFHTAPGEELVLNMHLDGQTPLPIPAKLVTVKPQRRLFVLGMSFHGGPGLNPLAKFIGRLEASWEALDKAYANES